MGQKRPVSDLIRKKLANTYALWLEVQGLLERKGKEQSTRQID